MAQQLTYHTAQSLTELGYPEPLTAELFPFIPRRLGKHQNVCVGFPWADIEEFVL